MSRTMARASTKPETTAACATRPIMKTVMLGASMQTSVATIMMAMLTSITGRRPKRSESGPMTSCRQAVAAR
ncbi:hypothetical protein D3C78_1784340 [compost metagenome]